MRKCNNCGKELNDNMAFCPECGSAQTEQEVILSEKTIPYIDEIIDRHLEHFPNKLEKEVETCVGMMANGHLYDLTIKSDTDTPLRIEVKFKNSSKRDQEALERLKTKKYFSRFTTNLTWTEGYSGYTDLAEDVNLAKSILSNLYKDIYQLQEHSPRSIVGYFIKVGGNSIGRFEIKDGVHVKSKGCLSVILALVVMGASFFSLM